ncbi:MAG: T9SS type A sorting domain-containing protein [Bacteroidetes bacterium]|nr:T9SS type A sorting domain-containing protein [Bacteroidota bacterium]
MKNKLQQNKKETHLTHQRGEHTHGKPPFGGMGGFWAFLLLLLTPFFWRGSVGEASAQVSLPASYGGPWTSSAAPPWTGWHGAINSNNPGFNFGDATGGSGYLKATTDYIGAYVSCIPGAVSYYAYYTSNAAFRIIEEESADGTTWTTLNGPHAVTAGAALYTTPLPLATTRYIRIRISTTAAGFIHMDAVSIANGSGTPFAYSASSVTQSNTSDILLQGVATSNNQIIGIPIVITGSCPPSIDATSFTLNTTGSTAPGTDITTAKLWYTGTSSVFATTTLFGTQASPNGAFTITGTQNLPAAGTYYFWLTYDIAAGAVTNNFVDAEVTSVTVGGSSYTPSPTTVAGNRKLWAFALSTSAVKTIASGYQENLAVCSDATVKAWGHNAMGELGYGNWILQNIPVTTIGLTGIISVAVGEYHSLALKSDGTVWSFGNNDFGGLGDNTIVTKNTPVQVHGPGNVGFLTGITAIAASGYGSIALKSDGTVWAWGNNGGGVLGDGTIIERWTPVQVLGPGGAGFLTGIAAVAKGFNHAVALKNDGTVWTWGQNVKSQLGDGTTTQRLTPVQVVTGVSGCATYLCSITAVAANGEHSIALRSDGTVWTWGYNLVGQLGNGLSGVGQDKSSPVQVLGPGGVGFLTGVMSIGAGYYTSLFVKSDSTAWAVGENTIGQLGNNTSGAGVISSTPTQMLGPGGVGFLTGVAAMSGGCCHTIALKGNGSVWETGQNASGVPSITPVQLTTLCTVSLPVELIYFNAVAENNNLVRCYWSTATEINNDYFAVERSKDGINFSQIGTVKGAGNSSITTNYIFYDHEPYSGLSYYRLKQFDYNGAFTYSEIRPVYIGTIDLITIYPNPSVNGSIEYIVASEAGGDVSVKVYDVLGRTVISNTETLEGGVVTRKLSTAALSSGSYLLQVTNGDLEKTQKQFVIK